MTSTIAETRITASAGVGFDYGLIIDGEEYGGSEGTIFDSIDPSTGRAHARIACATVEDLDVAIVAARRAFETHWRYTSATDRGRLLQAASRRLLELLDDLAELEARDCGKVLEQSIADVRIAARYLEIFGNAAAGHNGDHIPVAHDVIDFTVRQPFGVAGQINAWNFPINMAARSIGAALAAGNTVVVKTPELAPVTTTILGRVLLEVGVPGGVVNILHGPGRTIGEALSGHAGVDIITFTGSTVTGRKVAARAAEAITPVVMELGGKSPVLVFQDADLPKAAASLAEGFIEAAGQSCDLPSLAIVQREVYDEFVEMLAERVSEFRVGPAIDAPEVGPVISAVQLERITGFVTEAVDAGARVAIGGRRASAPGTEEGFFFEPTVLADVTPDMRIAQEEVFGPVLVVVPFDDEDDALRIANGTEYGLSSFVWTSDLARGVRLTKLIDAGQVYVNCFSSGDSPLLPFGGFKNSGYGREKGVDALRTYSQVKNVCISTR